MIIIVIVLRADDRLVLDYCAWCWEQCSEEADGNNISFSKMKYMSHIIANFFRWIFPALKFSSFFS